MKLLLLFTFFTSARATIEYTKYGECTKDGVDGFVTWDRPDKFFNRQGTLKNMPRPEDRYMKTVTYKDLIVFKSNFFYIANLTSGFVRMPGNTYEKSGNFSGGYESQRDPTDYDAWPYDWIGKSFYDLDYQLRLSNAYTILLYLDQSNIWFMSYGKCKTDFIQTSSCLFVFIYDYIEDKVVIRLGGPPTAAHDDETVLTRYDGPPEVGRFLSNTAMGAMFIKDDYMYIPENQRMRRIRLSDYYLETIAGDGSRSSSSDPRPCSDSIGVGKPLWDLNHGIYIESENKFYWDCYMSYKTNDIYDNMFLSMDMDTLEVKEELVPWKDPDWAFFIDNVIEPDHYNYHCEKIYKMTEDKIHCFIDDRYIILDRKDPDVAPIIVTGTVTDFYQASSLSGDLMPPYPTKIAYQGMLNHLIALEDGRILSSKGKYPKDDGGDMYTWMISDCVPELPSMTWDYVPDSAIAPAPSAPAPAPSAPGPAPGPAPSAPGPAPSGGSSSDDGSESGLTIVAFIMATLALIVGTINMVNKRSGAIRYSGGEYNQMEYQKREYRF